MVEVRLLLEAPGFCGGIADTIDSKPIAEKRTGATPVKSTYGDCSPMVEALGCEPRQ